MTPVKLCILILCSVTGHSKASILNRILDYWQPTDVYVVLNCTTINEDVIGGITYPRFVSVRGDFSSFTRQQIPIRSVFPDNFVLVVFTDESCGSVIPILRDQMSQAIIVKRSKVIVVTQQRVSGKTIEGMFRRLWKMGLLNVYVLDDAFVYGYNPFTNEFLIRHSVADYQLLISIDRAADFHGAQLRIPQFEVYPQAQNIIWHNRSIQIGEYIETQRPLADFFNATLWVYIPEMTNFGFELFVNETASKVLPGIGAELLQGRGDLTLISRAYDISNYFDFVMPLYFRDCSLLIPKSGRIPQYTIVVSVAATWLGLCTVISMLMTVICIGIIRKIFSIKVDLLRLTIEIASVYIGQSFRFSIRTESMRLMITCWLLVCIFLQPLFNAEIVTKFLKPIFLQDIDDPFEAIQEEGFTVYTFDGFLDFLKGNSKLLFPSEEMFQKLLKKSKSVVRDEFFYRVLHPNGRDMFMTMAMSDNLVEKTKYLTEQTYSYHKTKPFFISLIANIVPRGSIIYNHYNDFNYRIFEAGLKQHWKSLELLYEIKFGSGNEVQEKSLTTRDFYSAFLVLVLGYAVAATVFAMEMLRVKFSKFV